MTDTDDRLTFYYNRDKQAAIYALIANELTKHQHYLVDFYNEFLIDVYLLLDKKKANSIAIDWDNTISADLEFFTELLNKLLSAGYEPFVCSLRAPDEENLEEIRGLLEQSHIPIYMTDGRAKRDYLKKLGIKVHLWIDDFYPGICGDSCKLLTRNNIE